jgi:acyl-coenzyme A thioesterase PaaI-like protein
VGALGAAPRGHPLNAASLEARAAAALAIPLQEALGARPADPAAPTAGLLFPVRGLAINPGGTLHAGALGAILELQGFLTLLPELADDEHAVTHHISTQLLSPGQRDEEVLVTAVLERRTRRLGFVSATATVGDRLVARSQITKSVIAVR